jgi:hypothetical protein
MPSNEAGKEPSKRDLGLARTAGEGGVTEEISEKGGVLYEDKGNSEVCRSCENIFTIANTKVKALVKLERWVWLVVMYFVSVPFSSCVYFSIVDIIAEAVGVFFVTNAPNMNYKFLDLSIPIVVALAAGAGKCQEIS